MTRDTSGLSQNRQPISFTEGRIVSAPNNDLHRDRLAAASQTVNTSRLPIARICGFPRLEPR